MEDKILRIFLKRYEKIGYKGGVAKVIFDDEFEDMAQEIVKLFSIPNKVENYKKWQSVLKLQCICLLGDNKGVWRYTKERLDKLEKSIRQMPMVSEDYFYFNL